LIYDSLHLDLIKLRSKLSCNNPGDDNEVDPSIGEIYLIHCSVQKLFNTTSNIFSISSSSSTPSTASSTTSKNRKKKNKGKKRPCLIWETTPLIKVLCMATFGGANVDDPNVEFEPLSKDYVLQRMVPIHPKNMINGRKPIKAERIDKGPLLSTDQYLILIPATLEKKTTIGRPVPEYFPQHHLQYIKELLLEIGIDGKEEKANDILSINYLSILNKEDEDDDTSSASSSLPISRSSSTEFFFGKQTRTRNWIQSCKFK
jgi:hypothetical protein